MASKHPACDVSRLSLHPPATVRPLPLVERRLRAMFPEVWARYEWLLAARTSRRRSR